jgi:hypothetical protein
MSNKIGIDVVVDSGGVATIRDASNAIINDSKRVDQAYKKLRQTQDQVNRSASKFNRVGRQQARQYVNLGRDAERFNRAARDANRQVVTLRRNSDGLMMSLRRLRWNLFTVTFLLWGLKRAGDSVMEGFIAEEKATIALAAAMQKRGELTKRNLDLSLQFADALANQTGLRKREVATVEAIVRSYGIEQSQVQRTVKAVINLWLWRKKLQGASVTLSTASELVAKSYLGVTQQLKRHGIVINENITDVTKFEQVLRLIEKRMGNVEQVYSLTTAGMMDKLKKLIEDQKNILAPHFRWIAGRLGQMLTATVLFFSGAGQIIAGAFKLEKLQEDLAEFNKIGMEQLELLGDFATVAKDLDDAISGLSKTMANEINPLVLELSEQMRSLTTSTAQKQIEKLIGTMEKLGFAREDIVGKEPFLAFGATVEFQSAKAKQQFLKFEEDFKKLGINLRSALDNIVNKISDISIKERLKALKAHSKILEQMTALDKQYMNNRLNIDTQILDNTTKVIELERKKRQIAISRLELTEKERLSAIKIINDIATLEMQKAADKWLLIHGTFAQQVSALYDQMSDNIKASLNDAILKFPTGLIDTVSGNLEQFFFNVSSGSMTARDAISDFAKSFGQDILRMISKIAALKLVETFFTNIGLLTTTASNLTVRALNNELKSVVALTKAYSLLAAVKGVAGIAGGISGGSPTGGTSPAVTTGTTAFAANGGVVNGFKPLAMANGHVANEPTFGVIAEKSSAQPELVSPVGLMKKTFEDVLKGDGGRKIHNELKISAVDAQDVQRLFVENWNTLQQLFVNGIRQDDIIRSTIRTYT